MSAACMHWQTWPTAASRSSNTNPWRARQTRLSTVLYKLNVAYEREMAQNAIEAGNLASEELARQWANTNGAYRTRYRERRYGHVERWQRRAGPEGQDGRKRLRARGASPDAPRKSLQADRSPHSNRPAPSQRGALEPEPALTALPVRPRLASTRGKARQ